MILDLVLIGLVTTLEPLPLTAFILILLSKGGARKGAAFIFGWLLSLAIVIAITLLITGNKPPQSNTAPSLAALAAKIAIGVGLLAIAERQRRRIGRPKKPKKTPRWQAGLDNMSPLFVIGLAPLLQPWGLVAAGIATIVDAKLASLGSYIAIILFCLISTSAFLTMETYAVLRPDAAQAFLGRLRSWIDTHMDIVIVVASVLLGFWLIGKSLYLIASS
ncbi:MAG TPA: GAP family protein [Acidimicrobiales bacterium]|nr:GAP family protein [Acidimicrobiales bacterium]